jgi:branched-chain amino acid aminotransferase
MIVCFNGEFVPEERAVVSVFDRSFRYGDGLFETMLAVNGNFFRWPQHWTRLMNSARAFNFAIPWSSDDLQNSARELLEKNSRRDALVRLQISRGTGPRGYAPTGAEEPLLVMSAHAAPVRPAPPYKVVTAPFHVTADATLGHKTASRMLHVAAATHAATRGADEALLVDSSGRVCEGASSNVFWIRDGVLGTPPLQPNVLPGVTRAAVLELARALGVRAEEELLAAEKLPGCEGVFLTLTSRGVVGVESLDGVALPRSPLTARLQSELENLLQRECA